jgi:hypothetical protein
MGDVRRQYRPRCRPWRPKNVVRGAAQVWPTEPYSLARDTVLGGCLRDRQCVERHAAKHLVTSLARGSRRSEEVILDGGKYDSS